jgi:hypothetical protein
MDILYERMERLLDQTDTGFLRYLYRDIPWESRMVAIVGPRGVGKTTMLLQRLKLSRSEDSSVKALYATADDLYFSDHTLYETAERFSKDGGQVLYLDEIHKYPGWSSELKAIYDSFPDLKVQFTGSSILDIEKGEADLSRRAPKFLMQGLSFREFLWMRHGIHAPVLSLADIVDNNVRIEGVSHPLPYFKEYLANGYYPFGIDFAFEIELVQVVNRTLEVDIPQYADMNAATGRKLKRILTYVAKSVPYKLNVSKLAQAVGVSRSSVEDYLYFMEKAGLLAGLFSEVRAIRNVSRPEKLYLDNTNLMNVLSQGVPAVGTMRETFFLNQMRVRYDPLASPVSDFLVDGNTFEVGGPNKTGAQIADVPDSYVVRDDLETGFGRTIPLWTFGLTY